MTLKEYIEMGEIKAGSQAKLAKLLEIDSANLRKSKAGTQTLPEPLCIQLGQYIKVKPIKIIAASCLMTEKNPKRREILESCMAGVAIAAFTVGVLLNTIVDKKELMLHNNSYVQTIVSKYTL